MAERNPDTKRKIRDVASVLFRRDGYTGTGLKKISTESGAPFGSIYHFFPGGKVQLAEDSIRTAGPEYMELVLDRLESVDDPIDSIRNIFGEIARHLVATEYADACPIATVALEVASTNERLRIATADVFSEWVDAMTVWISRWADDGEQARSLARSFIMLLEGALMLSRAAHDPQPLYTAGESMAQLLHDTLAPAAA